MHGCEPLVSLGGVAYLEVLEESLVGETGIGHVEPESHTHFAVFTLVRDAHEGVEQPSEGFLCHVARLVRVILLEC